ncbi:hypothetical protein [Paenibacillus sp. BAC0078]
MSSSILQDKVLYSRLMAASLVLSTARFKMEQYMGIHQVSAMLDDQNYYEGLKMYYQEESEQLLLCADQSLYSSEEAEKELDVFYEETQISGN